MKEPTASAIAAATGVSIISGSILGLPAEALLAGFAGGLVALSFAEPMPWQRKAGTVATSTISAAYLAPVGAYVLPVPEQMPEVVALKAIAFVIGFGAMKILPLALERARGIISGKSERSDEGPSK